MSRRERDFNNLRNKVIENIRSCDDRELAILFSEEAFKDYSEKYFKPQDQYLQEKIDRKCEREYNVIASYLDSLMEVTNPASTFNESWINTSSVDSCIDSIKKLEVEEKSRKNEVIKICVQKGMIFDFISKKRYFLLKLKASKLDYSRSYICFLKNLYKLFLENDILIKSDESIYFFRKNFTILKNFFHGDISKEVIELLLLSKYGTNDFNSLSEEQKRHVRQRFHKDYFPSQSPQNPDPSMDVE